MDNYKKLNLGCGPTIAPNWINLDISYNIYLSKVPLLKWILYKIGLIPKAVYETNWPPGIIRYDLRKGLPYDDNSFDYIYTSHFLEHVKKNEAIKIIKECHRVLKPQGWIRIVVPDFKLLVNKYIKNELSVDDFLKALDMDSKKSFFKFLYSKDRHKWMYDFRSLNHLLIVCGFKNIIRKRFKESSVPDVDILDNRKESLHVDAQK